MDKESILIVNAVTVNLLEFELNKERIKAAIYKRAFENLDEKHKKGELPDHYNAHHKDLGLKYAIATTLVETLTLELEKYQ
jgi:hypothetical protein